MNDNPYKPGTVEHDVWERMPKSGQLKPDRHIDIIGYVVLGVALVIVVLAVVLV